MSDEMLQNIVDYWLCGGWQDDLAYKMFGPGEFKMAGPESNYILYETPEVSFIWTTRNAMEDTR